jgi:hypothetical protein
MSVEVRGAASIGRGGAGVDGHNPRPELNRRSFGGQVTQLAHRIVRVRLGNQHEIKYARILQVGDVVNGFGEAAGVAQKDSPGEFQDTWLSVLSQYCLRSSRLRIFPAPDMGMASTTSTLRGDL